MTYHSSIYSQLKEQYFKGPYDEKALFLKMICCLKNLRVQVYLK